MQITQASHLQRKRIQTLIVEVGYSGLTAVFDEDQPVGWLKWSFRTPDGTLVPHVGHYSIAQLENMSDDEVKAIISALIR